MTLKVIPIQSNPSWKLWENFTRSEGDAEHHGTILKFARTKAKFKIEVRDRIPGSNRPHSR